jgi:hypothetical protein
MVIPPPRLTSRDSRPVKAGSCKQPLGTRNERPSNRWNLQCKFRVLQNYVFWCLETSVTYCANYYNHNNYYNAYYKCVYTCNFHCDFYGDFWKKKCLIKKMLITLEGMSDADIAKMREWRRTLWTLLISLWIAWTVLLFYQNLFLLLQENIRSLRGRWAYTWSTKWNLVWAKMEPSANF